MTTNKPFNKVPENVKRAIREKYAWPGGYPLFLLTSDSAVLCVECGKTEYRQIAYSCRHNLSDGWKVESAVINWEDTDLHCDHCENQIGSAYGNDLQLTKTQANQGYHQGPCDQDIAQLRTIPAIKRQLNKLDPEQLRKELKEYGAWSSEELEDHEENLSRWLWLSCGDIVDRN